MIFSQQKARIYFFVFLLLCSGGKVNSQILQPVTSGDIVTYKGNSRGCGFVDYDGDGDLDLFVANREWDNVGKRNFLFTNNGSGELSLDTTAGTIALDEFASTGCSWADFNNDGNIDLFSAAANNDNNILYQNNGQGLFVDQTPLNFQLFQTDSRGVSWADYNLDGFLDLAVANLFRKINQSDTCSRIVSNGVYRNKGDGTFETITVGDIVKDSSNSISCHWIDYDLDGNLELFFSNGASSILCNSGSAVLQNFLYCYKGGDLFTRIVNVGDLLVDSFDSEGAAWADYDNDGYFEVYVGTKRDTAPNYLYDCDSSGFSRINPSDTLAAGNIAIDTIRSHGGSWDDVDNDGDLDLLVINYGRNELYLNSGAPDYRLDLDTSNIFTENDLTISSIWADVDKDGDRDLYVCNIITNSSDGENILYINQSEQNGNHWLNLKLEGTCSNRSAIGAIVKLQANISGQTITQYRQVSSQTNLSSHNSLNVHFGLGDATQIDSLIIEWPSGISQNMPDIGVDTFLTIIEPGGTAPEISSLAISSITTYSANISGTINPNGIWTTAYMEWGTDTTYSNRIPIFEVGVKITTDSLIQIPLFNLTSNTPYFFKWVAINAKDTVIQSGSFSTHPILFSQVQSGSIVTDQSLSVAGSWIDITKDGYLDLVVFNGTGSGHGANFFYRNNQDGTFTRRSGGELTNDVLPSVGATWGDYDNDSLIDVLVLNDGPEVVLYRNNGDLTFTGESLGGTGRFFGASWADVEGDGDLDLFVSSREGNESNILYLNEDDTLIAQTGFFDLIETVSIGVSWADANNDCYPDLFVANGGFVGSEPDYLYINDQDGTFTRELADELVTSPDHAQAGSWGDYNNDGNLDVFIANRDTGSVNPSFNSLFRNKGEAFEKMSSDSVGAIVTDAASAQSASWVDLDNDGDLDLFLVNGTGDNNFLYINDGYPTYTFYRDTSAIITTPTGNFIGSSWGDYDRDGDLDLFMANANPNEHNQVYSNMAVDSTTNHWAIFQLEGTISNRSAIGARISILAIIGGNEYWQTREISAQTGHASQNSLWAHFGLGDAIQIDSVVVKWPSGRNSFLASKGVDSIYTINEGPPDLFEEITDDVFEFNLGIDDGSISWGDFDNDDDLDLLISGEIQGFGEATKLLENIDGTFKEVPSTGLPGVAGGRAMFGDINHDDKLDIILTGGIFDEQTTKIFINTGSDIFSELLTASLEPLYLSYVDLGDFNNDGNVDILLNGTDGSQNLTKLYKGLGKGKFESISVNGLDQVANGELKWVDIENDGDLDFILTGEFDTLEHTRIANLYFNNGNETFDIIPLDTSKGFNIRSSSIAWGDYDDNGFLDLLLTGEFGVIEITRIYSNDTLGGFVERITPELERVQFGKSVWGDYDGDGDLDVLLNGALFTETDSFLYSKVYSKIGPDFFEVAHLTGTRDGAGSWADYDKDGDLDIVLIGNELVDLVLTPTLKVYKNNGHSTNISPNTPINLNAFPSGDSVELVWTPPSLSGSTPILALSYNIYVKPIAIGADTFHVSPLSNINTGFRKVVDLGNVQQNTSWWIKNLPEGGYIWSVQAIDHAFAGSPFAQADTFVISKDIPAPAFVSIEAPDCIHLGTETNIIIQAKVEDSLAVAEMILHYRPLSDTIWTQKTQNILALQYSFEVSETAFRDAVLASTRDNIGIEYYVEAINENQKSTLSNSGFVYICYNDPGLEFPKIKEGKKKEDYVMISFPLEPDNPALSQVLDPILGKPNRKNWRLFHTYNTGQDGKTELWEYSTKNSDFTTAERGKGYWLLSKEDAMIFTGPGTTTLPGDAPFSIQLKQGWNHIGNPYNFNLLWKDVADFNGLDIGDLQLTIFDRGYTSSNRLDRFAGALVHADNAVTIQIPTFKNPSAQTERRAKTYIYDPSHFFRNDAWFLPLSLIQGEDSLEIGGIGVHPDAKMSKDRFDRITPPRFFDYQEINFYHPEFFSPRFMVDVVPIRKDHVWFFQVESNLSPGLQTLSWSEPNIDFPGFHLMLLDVEEQKVIDMMEEQHYTFLLDGDSYQFQVFYGSKSYLDEAVQPQRIHVGKVYPNPTKRVLNVPISLPDQDGDYSVKIVVSDISGKQVLLIKEAKMPAGFGELSMDIESYTGHPLPSGIYVCQVIVYALNHSEVITEKILID